MDQVSLSVGVYSSAPLETGVFNLRVLLSDPTTGVTGQIDFPVTIKCSKAINVLVNPLTPLIYNVGTDTLIVTKLPVPTYSPYPADCFMGVLTFSLVYLNNP